jgi:general secretion pathway protein I
MNHQRGIALLEVIVAFAILAIALTVLLQATGSGNRLQRRAADEIHAVSHVESLLAELGGAIVLRAGVQTGDLDNRFRWRVAIAAPPQNIDSSARHGLYAIQVDVVWTDANAEKVVRVTTARIGKM